MLRNGCKPMMSTLVGIKKKTPSNVPSHPQKKKKKRQTLIESSSRRVKWLGKWVFGAYWAIFLRGWCAGCPLWWRPVSIPVTSGGGVRAWGGGWADPLQLITRRREWKREDSWPRTAEIAQGSAVLDSKWTTNTHGWTCINDTTSKREKKQNNDTA